MSGVRATASFPHGLRIDVVEQLPVAALTVAGGRTAVAADGVVLGPALLSSSLPLLKEAAVGSAAPVPVGRRVQGSSLLASLTVLGAAPAALAREVARVYTGPQGVTVAMHNGLVVYFGNATRPHAKWLVAGTGARRPQLRGRRLRGRARAGPPGRGLRVPQAPPKPAQRRRRRAPRSRPRRPNWPRA